MSVSVVIPTFDRADTTARAVRSAFAQTHPVHEVIVVDDGSAQPFRAAGQGLSDPRLRVIALPSNQGAAAARQAGVDAAIGSHVAFLDSDDWWHPDKLDAQMRFFAARDDELLAVSCGWIEEGRERWRLPKASSSRLDFASGCWFAPGSTVVLPRAAFERVGPINPSLRRLEDVEWFLRFGMAGGRLQVAPVIGATIAIGRRARLDTVRDACERMRHRFRGQLTSAEAVRLEAYLALELAAAARNEHRAVQAGWHLARSLFLKPRLQLSLMRWWRTGDKPFPLGTAD